MTSASVRAKISGYRLSEYTNQHGNPVTMSAVPKAVFSSIQLDIDEDIYYREQYDHIIKMAVLALQDTFSAELQGDSISQPVPLVLAMPEPLLAIKHIPSEMLISNMVKLSGASIDSKQVRCIHTGRAAGIQGLETAHRYLYDLDYDYVVIGGSDSYWNLSLINQLDDSERLLTENSQDGFSPGEAACFLLLSRLPQNALRRNNHIIAVHPPGIAEEAGHLGSEATYRGDGLDQAFKKALRHYSGPPVSCIYSSMNGESFWAKEYGVATLRNNKHFSENMGVEHPADCFGDLGAATGTTLVGLSALDLLNQRNPGTHLVYSSSDGAKRAAVLLEKIAC